MTGRVCTQARKAAWIAFCALIFTFGAGSSNCKKKNVEPKPVAEAGEILLSVKERPNLQSQPAEFTDIGGIATAEYVLENGPAFSDSRTRSFTGILRVPVRVQADEYFLSINRLSLSDGQGNPLAVYEPADIARLKESARFGVLVRVLITKDGSREPQIDEVPNDQPPPTSEPVTEFIPLKNVFADPTEILTTTDIEGALQRLHGIASATREYHEELFELVRGFEGRLAFANLDLVTEAAYFTFAMRQSIAEEYEALMKEGINGENEQVAIRLAANLQLADELGAYTNSIVVVGVSKLEELSYEEAKALAGKLFHHSNASSAIRAMVELLGELDGEQKLELMELALDKTAQAAASDLAISWFNEDSDRAVGTLLDLVARFSYGSRDRVLLGTLESIKSISSADAVKLVSAAYDKRLAVARGLLGKISNLTASDVVSLAGALTYGAKDRILQDGLALLPAVTARDAALLMGAGYDAKLAIGRLALPKIQGLTAPQLAQLAGILMYGARDALLVEGLPHVAAMDADGAALLAQTSYNRKLSISKAAIRKVNGLNAAALVLVASKLTYSSKDGILLDGITLIGPITESELLALVRAGYERKLKIAQDGFALVSAASAAGVVGVAGQLRYSEKDAFLVVAATGLNRISAAEAAAVTQAGYRRKLAIAKVAARKVGSLDPAGISTIASQLSHGSKDGLVLDVLSLLDAISESDAVTLIRAGYDQKPAIARAALAKVTRPTASGVVAMMAQLNYGSKDALLREAFARLPAITVQELQSLINASYNIRALVARTLLPKVASLNAAGVSTIAGMFSHGQRDDLLLQGMGLLRSMTASEIVALARVSYAKKKQIVMEADRFLTAVSAQELVALIGASGATDAQIALKYLPKLSDLGAASVVRVAGALSYGAKDTFVIAYLGRVQSLNTASLISVLGAMYDQKVKAVFENVLKLSDLTVSNAILLSRQLTYGNKDRLLMIAVDQVTDLTPTNALDLSRAGYQRQQQILEKALKRLENNG